jgi:polysaccharide biosynthesis transport protein
MTMTETPEFSLSGASQPSVLRTGWKWIAVVTVLLMAVTFYSDHKSHKSYTSTASVVLGSQVFASGAEPLPPDMGTAKTVATSSVVIDRASSSLGISPTHLRNDLSVTNPADTVVLTFAFKAAKPGMAQRGAQEIAQGFVRYQNSSLAAVQQQLRAKTTTGKSDSTLSVETATIISQADYPTKANGHSLLLDLIVALFAGVCLGIGTALLVDRSSDRVRGLADVEALAEKPVLAVIPQPSRHATSKDPVCIIRDDAVLRDAYRSLRVRTEISSADVLGVTMLVTRPTDQVRPAVPTALGLAVSLALSGRQVVLVGADLRACPLNQLFGTHGMAGLAEGLQNRSNWESALISTALPGLRLLTEGAQTAGAEELFGQQQLSRLFTTLRRSFADVIVVDGPPLLESPESLMFVDAATLVVLDVDGDRTSRTQLRGALGRLLDHRERMVGAVLTTGSRGWRGGAWVVGSGGLTRLGLLGRSVHAVRGLFGSAGRKPTRSARTSPDSTNGEVMVHWNDVEAEVHRMQAQPDGGVLTQVEDWSREERSRQDREIEGVVSDGHGAVGSRSWTK